MLGGFGANANVHFAPDGFFRGGLIKPFLVQFKPSPAIKPIRESTIVLKEERERETTQSVQMRTCTQF